VELVVLKHPKYVRWMISKQDATGSLARARTHAQSKITKFDAKPFTTTCEGRHCKNQATRCTVYSDNVTDPHWWCEECDPYQTGANAGKLQSLRTYAAACHHVELYCSSRLSDYKAIITAMAKAKGLPARVGEKEAGEFFS
jgi:hypothetical protein